VRWRRAGVVIAVVAAAVALGIVLGSSLSGSSGSPAKPKADAKATKNTAVAGGSASLVRNATPQPGWKPHTGPVPILEYHVLGAAPPDAPYPELYVTGPDFHRQMDWLEEHGYEAVTAEGSDLYTSNVEAMIDAGWELAGTRSTIRT
jgi:hypothetical protein